MGARGQDISQANLAAPSLLLIIVGGDGRMQDLVARARERLPKCAVLDHGVEHVHGFSVRPPQLVGGRTSRLDGQILDLRVRHDVVVQQNPQAMVPVPGDGCSEVDAAYQQAEGPPIGAEPSAFDASRVRAVECSLKVRDHLLHVERPLPLLSPGAHVLAPVGYPMSGCLDLQWLLFRLVLLALCHSYIAFQLLLATRASRSREPLDNTRAGRWTSMLQASACR